MLWCGPIHIVHIPMLTLECSTPDGVGIEWAPTFLYNALVRTSTRSALSRVGAESYQTCANIGLNGHKQVDIFTAKVAEVASSTYYQVDAAV